MFNKKAPLPAPETEKNGYYKGFESLARNYKDHVLVQYAQEIGIDHIEESTTRKQQGKDGPITVTKLRNVVLTPDRPTYLYKISIDAESHWQQHAVREAQKALTQPVGGIGLDVASIFTFKTPDGQTAPTIITVREASTENEKIIPHLSNMFVAMANVHQDAREYSSAAMAALLSQKLDTQVKLSDTPEDSTFTGMFPIRTEPKNKEKLESLLKDAFKDTTMQITLRESSFVKKSALDQETPYAVCIQFPKVEYKAVQRRLEKLEGGPLSPQIILQKLAM